MTLIKCLGRKSGTVIFLDTHIVVWLYFGLSEKLSPISTKLIDQEDLFVSPVVRLELQLLKEIGRIEVDPLRIVATLESDLDIHTVDLPSSKLISAAMDLEWTRDPFDRLIVAATIAARGKLISRDERIRKNFTGCVW
jgi:PIN domain nuclease of toxin-antitoxin system